MASRKEGHRALRQTPPSTLIIEIDGPHISEDIDAEEEDRSKAESVKDTFEHIIAKVEYLRKENQPGVLQKYVQQVHDEYFSSSDDIFSRLSLKDNFETLLKINKIDELQGPIGQAGVGQLVYRLANFQYRKENRSNEEIAEFIGNLLENKSTSDAVEVLIQLQTVAAHGLANGSWAEPVYEGIQEYLKTHNPNEVFILSKLKERLSQRLSAEEENPTMGVVTTLDNKHQGLMFENEVFDEELDSKVNNAFSFGSASKVRISALSRDYSGIFDTRNRLVSLVPADLITLTQTRPAESETGLSSMDDFYDSARYLNNRRNHIFNKVLYIFSRGILNPNPESPIVGQFAEILGIPSEELVSYIKNEKQYYDLEKEKREADDEMKSKSDHLYSLMKRGGFGFEKIQELEQTLYETFNEKYTERKNKRQPIETLDLTHQEDLGFLGLNEKNIALFKTLQDPYFTRAIQEAVGIALSDLDIRAQSAFLGYFAKATESDVKRFSELLSKFNVQDRVKICSAYLAFEDDASLGYIVENMCERPEVALPIMTVVYDLIGNAGKIEDFLLSEFKAGEDREVIASVYGKLIAKAKDILLHYNAETMGIDDMAEIAYGSEMMKDHADVLGEYGYSIDRSNDRMESYKAAEQNLVEKTRRELSNISVAQLLFLNSFKSLKEHGELDLDTIRGTFFEIESSADFASREKDVVRVKKLMKEAYRKESPEFQKAVIASFEKALSNPSSRFYALRRDDELIAALRFDETKDGGGNVVEKYFGSFVSDPAYGNGKLGEAVFEKALGAEAADRIPIHAHCNPLSPISQKYIEAGFVATKLETYADVPSFTITFDSSVNERSVTKRWPNERIVHAALEQNTDTIQVFSAPSPDAIPFDLVNEGYLLTRYMKIGGRFYIAFERIPASEETKGAA